MRALTAQESVVFNADARSYSHRVTILGPTAVWIALDSFLGEDWQQGFSTSEDLEGLPQAVVSLRRETQEYRSLSEYRLDSQANLLTGVYDPLLRAGREFKVEVALMPEGVAPGVGDWRLVFHGRIDDVDASSEVLTFAGRAKIIADANDTQIQSTLSYSDNVGVAVETLMGQLLTNNGLSAADFLTPVSPGWAVRKFEQMPKSVLDAIRDLSNQIGWTVGQRWDSFTSAFKLVFEAPARSAAVAQWSFSPDVYEDLTSFQTSRLDVRNKVAVYYSDGTVNASNELVRKVQVRNDGASQALYGIRFMAIGEASSSEINTATEAGNLAAAALADLKDVWATIGFTIPFHYGLQIGDMVELKADGIHFSGDQLAAVIAVSHEFGDEATTSVTLQGKPALSVSTWRSAEQGWNGNRSTNTLATEAPVAITTQALVGAVAIDFKPSATGREPAYYQLHTGAPGFTLDLTAASTTFRAQSVTTHFEYGGLRAGTTLGARIVPFAEDGTPGIPSAEQVVTPLYLGPASLLPALDFSAQPANGDFEANSDPLGPPDAWSYYDNTSSGGPWPWGTGAYRVTGTAALSGSTAIQFASLAEASIRSRKVNVVPGRTYTVEVNYKNSTAVGAYIASVYEYFGSGTIAPLSGVYIPLAAPLGAWKNFKFDYVPTPGAVSCAVQIETPSGFGGIANVVTIDAVEIYRSDTSPPAWTDVSNVGYSYPWRQYPGFETASFRQDHTGRVWLRGLVQPTAAVGAVLPIFTLPVGYRPAKTIIFAATGVAATHREVRVDAAGAVYPMQATPAGDYLSLAGISFTLEA